MAVPVTPALPTAGLVPLDGTKATYKATIAGLASAASCTDLFTLTGSATKVVRITRLEIQGEATTAVPVQITLLKRSTANTGGTLATAPALVPNDSASAAASATISAYTAVPTTGTLVGNIATYYLYLSAPATATAGPTQLFLNYGDRPAQCPVLRGITEVFAVNLGTTTITGGAFDINIEWTEE